MSAQQTTIEFLDAAGEFASKVSRALPGPIGYAVMGIGAIAKASAKAMRERGETVDQILLRINDPRPVVFPWEGAEDTKKETPTSKKKGDT